MLRMTVLVPALLCASFALAAAEPAAPAEAGPPIRKLDGHLVDLKGRGLYTWDGDIDGNDATERDAGWLPFIETPMHPEYPCAHCTFQGAAAAVLQLLFGDAATATGPASRAAAFARANDAVRRGRQLQVI